MEPRSRSVMEDDDRAGQVDKGFLSMITEMHHGMVP